jgi:hypothetical protein
LLTQGVVRGFQIRHELKRRHAAINRKTSPRPV